MKRMANAVELLNSGRVTGADGKLLRLHRIPLPYRTALADLRSLIAKARRESHASMRVGGSQFAAAIDYVRSAGQEDRLTRKHAAAREKVGWFDGSHKVFEWLSSGRRMRDRSYSFSMMAPFTIFPFPAEDVADLCLGFIEIYSAMNASLLERVFARAGVKASIFTPPESNDKFLEAESRHGNRILVVHVSPQLREQMLLELMTAANVIGAVQGLLRELDRDPPGEQEGHIVALSDEGRVWETP